MQKFAIPLMALILSICLFTPAWSQEGSAPLSSNETTTADEAAISEMVRQYFEAFARKDLEDLERHWSASASDPAGRKQAWQHEFAPTTRIEVRNLVIARVTVVGGGKAKVRVAVEIKNSGAATEPRDFGKVNRVFECVRENGSWKIAREADAEEDLAGMLAAATTDTERSSMIAQNRDLLNSTLVKALVAQGNVVRNKGSFPEALRIYQLAQSEAESIGDRSGVALSLRAIGTGKRMQGDYDVAMNYYRESLVIDEADHNKSGIAASLNYIAAVEYLRGEYAQAIEAYEKSLKLSEEQNDTEGRGNVLNNIGLVYREYGNYLTSLDYFQKSLALTDPKNKFGITSTLLNIGNLYLAVGNYPAALDYLHQTLKQAAELGAKAITWKALQGIGIVQRHLGNYAEALENLQQALNILDSLASKDRITSVLNEIGDVYFEQRDFSRARDFFQKSLGIDETLGIRNPAALDGLAHTYDALGNYAKALEFAERAVTMAREDDSNDALWQARTTAGRIYLKLNQNDKARQEFAEAIRTIESLRTEVPGGEQGREQFFEDKLEPYTEMVGLLLAQGDTTAALFYGERAKSRVLLDVLRSGKTRVNKALSSAERSHEQELVASLVALNTQIAREKARDKPDAARIADLNARLEKARLDREEFQTSLYAAHPELRTLRGESEPLKLDQAGELLPNSRTALVEYVLAGDQVCMFVLTRSAGDAHVDLKALTLSVKRSDLAIRVEKFRQRLANHDLEYGDQATELYNLLIKPAIGQLRGRSTLVLAPDDILWDLPFQALQSPSGRFLVEDYAISYAPSLTVLREMLVKQHNQRHQSVTGRSELLAVGNPALGRQTVERARTVLTGEQLDPLPEAERQVKMLGQLYGAERSRIYIGAEAREERVKAEASKYRILQLATHGVLNNANPMYSHIVLSQSADNPREDGLLEAWEIMDLDLNNDLVVLSACDTARGRIGAGEGVIGLSWAFFVAGSPATVVSQWSVESTSTTELMLNFHRSLNSPVKSGATAITKAEALRQAQLKLLRTKAYQHPFYWAGFVLVGDGT